jgi:hypothetical protein
MPITLGILAQARQAVSTGAYDLLTTQVLGSAASSITFSSLGTYATTYQHLQIRLAVGSSVESSTKFRLNGDSTGNYSVHVLQGNGSAASSFAEVSVGAGFIGYDFSGVMSAVIDLLDPFETTKFKTTRTLSGTTLNGNRVYLTSSNHRSTAATSSINIFSESGNFITGSRFSLYGIKATT